MLEWKWRVKSITEETRRYIHATIWAGGAWKITMSWTRYGYAVNSRDINETASALQTSSSRNLKAVTIFVHKVRWNEVEKKLEEKLKK